MKHAKAQDENGRWYVASYAEDNIPLKSEHILLTKEEHLMLMSGYVFDENGNIVKYVPVLTEGHIRSEAARRLEELGNPYTPNERETWARQIDEARRFLETGNPDDAPFLSIRASARNVSLTDMTNRVLLKGSEFALASATILARQDILIAMNPIPVDYQDDKYWI